MIEIIIPETPWVNDNPKILFEMPIKKHITLFEAKKLIQTTSFKLKKNHWIFIQSNSGCVGQRSQYIKEEN